MLYNLLKDTLPDWLIPTIGAVLGCVITWILLRKPFAFLPKDGGKKVETPDGKIIVINDKSNGKTTGVGVVFVPVFLLMTLLFLPLGAELSINLGLMFLMMLTGYLDDASNVPWGELVKGLLDLVISIAAVVTFLAFNGSDIIFFGGVFHMPVVIYGILGVILMWASINVTNCSDGVDGLCGSVSVVSFAAYFLIFRGWLYGWVGILLAAVLLAYLWYNWNPSKVLMGDAGSRTIGYLLALLAMQSGHPFLFLLMSLVFIFDGGMGLIKVSLIRYLKMKNAFKNIQFPFHDHMRKRLGIPVKKIVVIFIIAQILFCFLAWLVTLL
ncbi:MAG: phospho-N-acetylmuramoyl-pentapeptide-transferase [Eubacterium sp.]|nr:phospho-N-acetylmuramoyl-pentapeptide-transferase [Eubacterium sp.]